MHFYQNVYTVWRYTDSFLYSHINPAIELIIIALLSDVKFVAFFPYYFFSPNFCFARLSQFIFIKRSNKFFIIEITDNICSRQFYLTTKTSSDQYRLQRIASTILHFDILSWTPTLNSGSLPLFSKSNSIYILDLKLIGFILSFYGFCYWTFRLPYLTEQCTCSLILTTLPNLAMYSFLILTTSDVFRFNFPNS